MTRTGTRLYGSRPRPAPLALASSLVTGAAMGLVHYPFTGSPLVVLPLAVVLAMIAREATARGAARTAFLAFLGFYGVHLFWLPQAFSSFLAPAVVWVLFPLVWPIKAAFVALTAAVAHRLSAGPLPRLAVLACAIVVLEWLTSLGPLAFPWSFFGYALLPTPLAQVASLGGVLLASLLVTGLAAALAALAWAEWRPLGLVALAWLAALGFGLTRPAPPAPTETARLVQGNIDFLRRAAGGIGESDFTAYRDLSRGAGPDELVVWPEAAVRLEDALRSGVPRLLSGVEDYSRGRRDNAVSAAQEGQAVGRSLKARLVPFGEYFPLQNELGFVYRPVFRLLGFQFELTSGRAGDELNVLSLGRDRIGAYVCYDSVFPGVARSLVNRGANVLVNVSNDGWYGGTAGVDQHFAMGRMRAIEGGRYLLRAGNIGITAVVDPLGRVVADLPQRVRDTLTVRYALIGGLTPYARFGDWPVPVALVVGLAFAFVGRRPQRLI